jgi:AraC-like DNA-binding protein
MSPSRDPRSTSRPCPSQLARLFLAHAARLGVEIEPLARRFGDASAIAFEQLLELSDELARAAAQPYFGVDVARHLPRGAYGIVEYAAASAASLGQALDLVLRCHALGSARARVAIAREPGAVVLEHWIDHPAARRAIHVNEFALAAYVTLGARVLGWRPPLRAVRFLHPGPAERRAWLEHQFAAPVELAASRNALVFEEAMLATAPASSDPALFAILAAHAERDLRELEPHGGFVDEVRSVYRRLLIESPHQAQAHDVARALALSPRTLHRWLTRNAVSFRTIEADVKRQLALGYLRDPRRSLAEIARLVGFSEPSTLVRACRRWTGRTPGELRRAVGGAVGGADAIMGACSATPCSGS